MGMARVTGVAALILFARIGDHRGGELRLHLEGGNQGVLGLHDLVARFSVQLESNGEQQGGSPLAGQPIAKAAGREYSCRSSLVPSHSRVAERHFGGTNLTGKNRIISKTEQRPVLRAVSAHSLAIFGITSVRKSSSERSASASDMVPRNR